VQLLSAEPGTAGSVPPRTMGSHLSSPNELAPRDRLVLHCCKCHVPKSLFFFNIFFKYFLKSVYEIFFKIFFFFKIFVFSFSFSKSFFCFKIFFLLEPVLV